MEYYEEARRVCEWIKATAFIPVTDFANSLKRRHKGGKKRK